MLHIIKVNKSQNIFGKYFLWEKSQFRYKFECKYMKVGIRHLFSYLWAATIYTRLTATAESLLIIPKVNSHMRFSPWVKSLRLWGFMIQNQQYQLSTIKMFLVFFHHRFSSFISYNKESWVLTKFLKIYWYDAFLSLH